MSSSRRRKRSGLLGPSEVRVTGQADILEGAIRLSAALRGKSKSDLPPRVCGGCGATIKPGGRMVYTTDSPAVYVGDVGHIIACDACMTDEQRAEWHL